MFTILFFGILIPVVGIKGDEELVPIDNRQLTFNGIPFECWDPRRVIDGNNRTDAGACSCCTAIQRPAWIAIDLLQPYPLTRIQVYGRTDTVSNLLTVPGLNYSVNQAATFALCSADHAIDGKYSSSYPDGLDICRQCSATDDDPLPWWEINFGQKVIANFITIIGRLGSPEEQSKDLLVYTSDAPQTNDNHSLVIMVKDWKSNIGQLIYLGNRTFQYLLIRRWYESVLTICEVMIYRKDCDDGTFGMTCQPCGRCRMSAICNKTTGFCQNGCEPGWALDDCIMACDPGYFGGNCSAQCHCQNDSVCDHVFGNCPNNRCAAGWKGDKCSTECCQGFYGINCSSVCHCKNGVYCDHVFGNCSDKLCAPGWFSDDCSQECTNGTYGVDCRNVCGQCNGSFCDNIDGLCTRGCLPGWTGYQCLAEQDHPTASNNDPNRIPLSAIIAVALVLSISVGANIMLATLYIRRRRNLSSGKSCDTTVQWPSSITPNDYDLISSLKEIHDYEGLQRPTSGQTKQRVNVVPTQTTSE
ncbi:uncharacterized protein LOC127866938 isoform X2 [Dreissena polymorpha]|uniref:uncharacterized protein LOC127866938 isoform X2 n=1 Tax=Dreissena polymorpha TaxID=45954 RepID=UPI0022649D7D|nr:uncharacterized protein LOC127866938 isoform X2 [Dreissena polymorpha]